MMAGWDDGWLRCDVEMDGTARGGTSKGIGVRSVWEMISARMFGQIALWGCLLMLMGLVGDIELDCGENGDHEKRERSLL